MTEPTFNQKAAEQYAQSAIAELDRIPVGRVPTDVLLAHSAKASAIAGIGIVHALLDVAAAIREDTDQEGN